LGPVSPIEVPGSNIELPVIDSYELNCLSDLAPLRGVWDDLLKQTTNHSFFQTLEWLEASWDNYQHPQRLRVIVVCRDSRPIGIVPWCVRQEMRRVGAVRVLTYPLDDWGTFYGPLGAEPRTAIRAAFKHLAETARDWDLIDLRWVDEAADEFLTIGESMRESSYSFRVRPRMEVRLFRPTDGWDAYCRSRSRNWRRKMQYDINVLERAGEVRLLRYRPAAGQGSPAEHARIYEMCERIAATTWQADDPSQSTLCSPRVRETFLRIHHAAAELGMLDANILLVGDEPVAFNYNYVTEGRVYGLRCGYDPTRGLEGCGRVLLYKMLEDSFERGDVEYNFGPGRQAYKERFATEMRHAYTFCHYARYSLRSQLLHLKDEVESRLWSESDVVERHLVD
jgi:CelD/BcsL family acetyltransferase involved in cellulose biosynthesis